MKNVVVIPVYKEQPTENELLSLRQCLRILGSHDIRLVAPEGLNLEVYRYTFETFQQTMVVEMFQPSYFASINGYNKLMLSKCFYTRFSDWEYMLIYQLDAWVFRDELDAWCEKGYDYIGAPWMKLNGKLDEKNCGNGGFSLRHIPAFIELFNHTGRLWGYKGLACWYRYRGPLRKPLFILMGLFGYHNRLNDFTIGGDDNEDLFFATLKYKKGISFRIPFSREAMYFAFEESPAMLYKKTGNNLPFGCHAWEKCEYETFWSKFISLS
ncbi:DUF5672 family protein [Parabacteroides sp.]